MRNNLKKRVVVTGLGVVSSIGIGKSFFWNNLVSGMSGISKVASIDTSGHMTHKGGEIRDFHPENYIDRKRIKFMSRGSQLALTAAKLAMKDASLQVLNGNRVGFCLGTTLGELLALEKMDRDWVQNGADSIDKLLAFQFPTTNMASSVCIDLKIGGPMRVFTTACASGNYAVGMGYDLILNNDADMVLAGGADAFAWIPFTGFNQFRSVAPDKVQPFDKGRKGMMVGEGAGILVLECLEKAMQRKAKIYAEILGYGLSCDAFHVTNTQADGIYECMADAIKKSGITCDDVDYICAHGTGTKQNDKAETAAIRRLFGVRSDKILVSSIKSMLGHTMGAASAIEAIACCLAVENNIAPPTINFETADPECNLDIVPNKARKRRIRTVLNNGFGFGGNNACLVIAKYKE